MPAVRSTVLITGLNGYIAGRTAQLALEQGHRVRGTVRNLDAGHKVKDFLCDMGFSAANIEVFHVPDQTIIGAFDLAATGCTAILHLAAPLREIYSLSPVEVVRQGVDSTVQVLQSAVRAGPQLQGVVLMSSAAALFDTPHEGRIHNEADWNTTSSRLVQEMGAEAGGFNAYCASKTMSETAFWKFRDTQQPSFGMSALHPTYCIGRPLIPWETPEQIPYASSPIWKVVSGQDIPPPTMIYEDTVDIRDVARVALWAAFNPAKSNGQRYICSSAVGGGQAIADILRTYRPSLKVKQGWPGEGYRAHYALKPGVIGFAQRKARDATGQDWIPYEHTIIDMADFMKQYYLD
ncbi:hypothetical protein GGR56DRAFT_655396 [Xylariaceae sp. FL0804]|nr:hypothetical protein GGR56DRAFT_655396 [Xylariaceae sp. FL0804]